ncbi:zinc-dependent metalloprotease [Bifidobacterium jacchi]|uniref:Hydrolase n=1 Tax=Bifidobacterium jacchi TaxID=2490545 RepID=A0A5N5RGD6_9BIFI|nr:zinc-dependent metalloprotease [Bifidobacterium jacchi]KAB5605970.1 hydrolase [Bifidobacterium jacchi]
MDENAIHQWLIKCFGPVQGEMAWNQIGSMPEEIREQLLSQDPSKLPDPSEVRTLMQAFTAGGLNTPADMQRTVEEGPINVKLAKSLALQQARGQRSGDQRTGDDGSSSAPSSADTLNASQAQIARTAMSEANLWLDTACAFNPAPGEAQMMTRTGWIEGTIDAWAKFAAPVAQSMNDALASVISQRLGDSFDGQIAGMFAGPVPIPVPDGMKDPGQLFKLLGNTSFAMQLGHAAGDLAHEVHGSFDQGIALLNNPAGGLIVRNIEEYAASLDLPQSEVTAFLALREAAHARLFASVPWLMPRFEALIGKYARGVDIDLDAMEEQLREATSMDPESISGAVNLTKVGIPDTPEQREAMNSLETLLALVEGWVDCVTWRAGMPHIAHIEQLREMMRRERAVGGPAERTFESLLGMRLRPKRMREAAALWERIGNDEGVEARDAKWSHPDLLPTLPTDHPAGSVGGGPASAASVADGASEAAVGQDGASSIAASGSIPGAIDWDAELSKLLDGDAGDAGDLGDAGDAGDAGVSGNADDSGDAHDGGDSDAGGEAGTADATGDDRTGGDDLK